MRKTHFILGLTIFLGIPILLILDSFPKAQAQNVIELACPSGSYALGGLTTRNPGTGGIRQYGCVDANGNLSVSNAVGSVVLLTPISGNQVIQGVSGYSGQFIIKQAPSSGTTVIAGFQDNGNNNIFLVQTTLATLAVPLANQSVAFASLGAVPGAGQQKFCSDCTTAATCAGAGSGHLAVSNGTNWTCQ